MFKLSLRPERHIRGFTLIELMIVIAIIAILAAILIPNFAKAKAEANLSACKENLKNIGTACEMYAADNDGFYPSALKKLTPDYLNSIPNCPSGSRFKEQNNVYGYAFQANPNIYVVHCHMTNHGKPVANTPNYSNICGLCEDMSLPDIKAKYFK